MCDLLGISCNEKERASRSLPLFANLYSDDNPHGWGIAYFDGARVVVKRDTGKARKSNKFEEIWNKVSSRNFVAHVRRKSQGEENVLNCHPFKNKLMGRELMFAHNGTVYDVRRNKPVTIHKNACGGTDSESIFFEMVDYMRDYMKAGRIHGLYPALVYAIRKIFERYTRSITLNFLMSDGSMYYAFNHYPSAPVYMLRRKPGLGKPSDSSKRAILFSTKKFTNENWIKIPKDQLLVANNGEIITLSDPV